MAVRLSTVVVGGKMTRLRPDWKLVPLGVATTGGVTGVVLVGGVTGVVFVGGVTTGGVLFWQTCVTGSNTSQDTHTLLWILKYFAVLGHAIQVTPL